MVISAKHSKDSHCKMKEVISKNECFNAVGVAFLIAQGCQTIVQATLGWGMVCVEQRHRCWAFSAQFTINYGIKKRQSWYKKNVSTPSVLRFLSVIRHESFRYNHAFSKKAQHRWRWISLRTFPRGRLVPRQPRAIKSTTRTELRGEGIYFAKFIHWDNSAIPTQMRDETIVDVTWLIIKGEIV